VIDAEATFVTSNISEFIDQVPYSTMNAVGRTLDNIETFLDGMQENEPGDIDVRTFQQELQSYAHVRLQINQNDLQQLIAGDREVTKRLKEQVRSALFAIYLNRVAFTIQKRGGELSNPEQLAVAEADWKKVKDYYLTEINKVYKQKIDDIHSGQSISRATFKVRLLNDMPDLAYRKRNDHFPMPITTGKRIAIINPTKITSAYYINGQPAQLCCSSLPLCLNGKKEEESFRIYSHRTCDLPPTLSHSFGVYELNRLNQSESRS
jgi:hypothetical protein